MKENLKEQFAKGAEFYERLAQGAKQFAEQATTGSELQKEEILAAEYNLGRAAAFREALRFVEEFIG